MTAVRLLGRRWPVHTFTFVCPDLLLWDAWVAITGCQPFHHPIHGAALGEPRPHRLSALT